MLSKFKINLPLFSGAAQEKTGVDAASPSRSTAAQSKENSDPMDVEPMATPEISRIVVEEPGAPKKGI